MAVGALIGAYQESDNGELRALLPLAGRTLIEYQARCAAAAGAAPIVVMVERVPPALHEALERLRGDGLAVIPVSDGNEAASRRSYCTTIPLCWRSSSAFEAGHCQSPIRLNMGSLM